MWIMGSKLQSEEKTLIVVQTLFYFSNTLASVFLSIFIFKLGGFSSVTLFNLFNYLFLLVGYIASGFFLKKISTRRSIAASFVLFSIFWAILFFLKESSIQYLVLLGTAYGIGQGLFWSGINLSQYIISHKDRRNDYFGALSSWSHLARAVAPGIGGILIGSLVGNLFDGYSIIFLLVLILNIITIYFAIQLPKHSGIAFSLAHIFTHKRSRIWNHILKQQFILGLWDISLANLLSVLLFLIFLGEFEVGIANMVLNAVAAIAATYTAKILHKYPRATIISGILSGIGILLIAMFPSIYGFLAFTFGTILGYQLISVSLFTSLFSGIDHNPEPWQQKYHMLIERDTVLGIARSLSFVVLWFAFTYYPKEVVAPIWLSIISIFPPILGILLVQKPREVVKN